MTVEQWTLVVALATLLVALLTLGAIFLARFRDRVGLEIKSIEDKGDFAKITIRNNGGTPANIDKVFFDNGHPWPTSGGFPALAGRSEIEVHFVISVIQQEVGGSTKAYAQDTAGRTSPKVDIPPAILARLRA